MASLTKAKPKHLLTRQVRTSRVVVVAAATALLVAPIIALQNDSAIASLTESYDFNTAGSLAQDFNSVGSNVSQSATGGISNSGALHAPGSANAIFSSKNSYSLGPVGSTYVFETFLQSIGQAGYSGVGFTASSPAVPTGGVIPNPYRPNDAIGISVHGNGFVFHNGATNIPGNWNADNTGIATVKKSAILGLLDSGSPDRWYKVVFKIVRDSDTTFDTRVEIWPSDSLGVLLRPSEADAIFELRDIQNSTLTGAPAIFSYFNFSGDRVRYFDDLSINLSGGATVVSDGAPVVLTSSLDTSRAPIEVSASLESDGVAALVERGFVFGITSTPEIGTDTKVVAGLGSGAFTAEAPALPAGQYFVRAFATNANSLTSYGVSLSFEVAAPAASSSGTAFESAPQKQHVSTINRTPSSGDTVTMFGTFFEQVTEAFVGGVKVDVVSRAANSLTLRMPRGVSGVVDVRLISPLGTLLLSRHFTLGNIPLASKKARFSIAGFDHNSRKLSIRMKTRIERWLDRNPEMLTLTCTGFTSLPRRATDIVLSTNRGATACNFAKRMKPDLEIVVVPGIEDPRLGVKVRRAMLVLTR